MRLFGKDMSDGDTPHDDEDEDDDAWAWLPPRPTPRLQLVPEQHDLDPDDDIEPEPQHDTDAVLPQYEWEPEPLALDPAEPRLRPWWHAVGARGWAALAAAVAVSAGILVVAAAPHHHQLPDSVPPISATAAITTTTAAPGPCAGLTGAVVTEGPGDRASVAGVITAFENAYYTVRSADAAMQLLAPESGIDHDALATGIASIPAGTTHCVAVTPISGSAANTHVVELHPDGRRVDYLQVIDTHPAPDGGGLQISNIQRQG